MGCQLELGWQFVIDFQAEIVHQVELVNRRKKDKTHVMEYCRATLNDP